MRGLTEPRKKFWNFVDSKKVRKLEASYAVKWQNRARRFVQFSNCRRDVATAHKKVPIIFKSERKDKKQARVSKQAEAVRRIKYRCCSKECSRKIRINHGGKEQVNHTFCETRHASCFYGCRGGNAYLVHTMRWPCDRNFSVLAFQKLYKCGTKPKDGRNTWTRQDSQPRTSIRGARDSRSLHRLGHDAPGEAL